MIGDVGVGKTSLVRQFVHQVFDDTYLSTIGVRVDSKNMKIDGQEVNMLLWDLAGEMSQAKVFKDYLKGAHGVIAVFDITRPDSYENVLGIVSNEEWNISQIPSLIIGNKNDLKVDGDVESGYTCDLFTSAKNNENVESVFDSIAKKILHD